MAAAVMYFNEKICGIVVFTDFTEIKCELGGGMVVFMEFEAGCKITDFS